MNDTILYQHRRIVEIEAVNEKQSLNATSLQTDVEGNVVFICQLLTKLCCTILQFIKKLAKSNRGGNVDFDAVAL